MLITNGCADDSPLVIGGMYAEYSSALPLDWVSSNAEIKVVDAVFSTDGSVIENKDELKGNIALMLVRDTTREERLAAKAGAVAVYLVSTRRLVAEKSNNPDYKSEIPVITIKSSDATRLRKQGRALIRDKGTPRF